MADSANRRKIKNYLINKDVQLKFISISFLHMLLVSIVTAAVVLSPVVSLLYQPLDTKMQYEAAKIVLVILEKLVPVLGAVLLLSFVNLVLVTHKFCGPIVNFRNTFHKIADIDFTRKINLRNKDFLQAEGEAVNKMIDALSAAVSNIKQDHGKLTATLNEAAQAALSNKQQLSRDALRLALDQAQLVSEHLSRFTLEQ